MSKTAIIYWSGTGNTKSMADAITEGAQVQNPDAVCFSVSDITPEEAAQYDTLILGCPAMGAEVLEEDEFEPFFTGLESLISGKNIALFGSYGWGDGEWMRSWEERVKNAGANLFGGEGLMINETPDDEGLRLCKAFGETAVIA